MKLPSGYACMPGVCETGEGEHQREKMNVSKERLHNMEDGNDH